MNKIRRTADYNETEKNMLETGIKGREELTVTEDKTAKNVGSGELEVFATPAMAALMEKTAYKSVADKLGEGEGTVGISLDLKHIAPTPVGMKVVCESELVEVDGRKLTFDIKVSDEKEKVGTAKHCRFIINNAKFSAKAAGKAKK